MMASPGDGGKAGAVGDLSGRRLEELLEILERQEKLISNKRFLARLPDRGEKVLDYTDKVRIAITQHKRLLETTSLLSAFKVELEEKRPNVTEGSEMPADPGNKKTAASPGRTLRNKTLPETENTPNLDASSNPLPIAEHKPCVDTQSPPLPLDSLCDESRSSVALPVDTLSEARNRPRLAADGPPVREQREQNTTSNGAASADDLLDGLKMISIKDSTEISDASETALQDQATLTPVVKKSYFVEVLEQRAKNPTCQKRKFQANRLPSDSDCSMANQSPRERVLRLSAEERRDQDRKHLDDITAATLPPLHHSPAQLLPIEESLTLQIAQEKSYEEKQAKLAAQKLLEKLNIKMGAFNPEGDSYMKYRDDEEGHGAEE